MMNFEFFFKGISYLVVFFGFLSLWISGGIGVLIAIIFFLSFFAAWQIEDSKWQLSEKLGTIILFFIIPVFYILWKSQILGFGSNEIVIAAFLGRVILVLSVIKLLQKKSNKDWVFLYLISFFEVLLAAGLSISPLYLLSFILFLVTIICATVVFEIKKTSQSTSKKFDIKEDPLSATKENLFNKISFFKLPKLTIALLCLMIAIAAPVFYLLPRVASAGFGSESKGLSGFSGFSDSVTLGAIGSLKQSDEIVMRVRVEKINEKKFGSLHWRGVALDSFDNKIWSKSKNVITEIVDKGNRDFFIVDYSANKNDLTAQTVYLEPLDSTVMFGLASPTAVQAGFQSIIKDSEGSLNFLQTSFERKTYKVFSDETLPGIDALRADDKKYSSQDNRYLELPADIDERIARFTDELVGQATSRYDKANIIENYLQNNLGYTLEMRASGEQPLADFLFNIREGHCEYFATAMAVMLRTQGVATRIVNGFQEGDYNETADVYVVRQRNAHSWVEVYFPEEDVWVPFDPTPFAGQNDGTISLGVFEKFNNYVEALETFWIQYFVSYDNQEQRSLFRTAKNSFSEFQAGFSDSVNKYQQKFSEWLKEVRGDYGLLESIKAVGLGALYLITGVFIILVLIWSYRKTVKFELWRKIFFWTKRNNEITIIEFYERMQKILVNKGLIRPPHQTPLEFALEINIPEAIYITKKYNHVRFGEENLSNDETGKIESLLKKLAESGGNK